MMPVLLKPRVSSPSPSRSRSRSCEVRRPLSPLLLHVHIQRIFVLHLLLHHLGIDVSSRARSRGPAVRHAGRGVHGRRKVWRHHPSSCVAHHRRTVQAALLFLGCFSGEEAGARENKGRERERERSSVLHTRSRGDVRESRRVFGNNGERPDHTYGHCIQLSVGWRVSHSSRTLRGRGFFFCVHFLTRE